MEAGLERGWTAPVVMAVAEKAVALQVVVEVPD